MILSQYLINKNNFSGVAMIRIVYKGGCYDYSKWRLSNEYLFFYDDNFKIIHMLYITDCIKEIDDTHIVINYDNKYDIGLELFYGGAIL